jgi:hypothetical protein
MPADGTEAHGWLIDGNDAGHVMDNAILKRIRLIGRVRAIGDALAAILLAVIVKEELLGHALDDFDDPGFVFFARVIGFQEGGGATGEESEALVLFGFLLRGKGFAIHGDESPEEATVDFDDFFRPEVAASAGGALDGKKAEGVGGLSFVMVGDLMLDHKLNGLKGRRIRLGGWSLGTEIGRKQSHGHRNCRDAQGG